MLAGHSAKLRLAVDALAQADVLAALAERAYSLGLQPPTFQEQRSINIDQGWHPVVKSASTNAFIANDVALNADTSMLIVTGPNMGGKSTYMRQVAIISLLAYVGSYVPAKAAVLGPIDRIFTRIGAADDLTSGRSTFMVEMTETANILHNATANSLVLLDEIGRGTSTYDGLALAWACAQNLAEAAQSLTLFATHYFELTSLPQLCENVSNVHLSAREHGGNIVFMYQVQPGPANQSYGIQVAKLAGVPAPVLALARARLNSLEEASRRDQEAALNQPDLFIAGASSQDQQTSDANRAAEPVLERLRALDPDDLSPRQAWEALEDLKRLLSD